jgi:hypothetical protein
MVEIIKNNGRYNFFRGAWPKMEKRRKMAKKTQITADLTNFYSFLAQN